MNEPIHITADNFNFKEKIICVTGGNGFIGKKLIEELSKIKCHIKILTRKKDSKFPNNLEVFFGDLTDPDLSLAKFIEGCDVLFHCAGEINNEARMSSLHINGTQKLIDSVRNEIKLSKKMIHWVQLSSCGAYGPPPNNNIEIKREITEFSSTNPINEYEKTKAKSDELVITSSVNNFSYTILRPSNVIGASMTNQSIRKLIKLVHSGRFFFIGKKDAIATFIHVNDVAKAMILIASNSRSRNEIFNLSNDCSWEALIIHISSILNVSILPLRVPYKLIQIPVYSLKLIIGRFIHVPQFATFALRTKYSTQKIESYLNFKFTKPMPDSIDDLIKEMKILPLRKSQ
jgi:nucleoside-diphosphate-sugar epimerase